MFSRDYSYIVRQLVEITHTSDREAGRLLREANGNLESALALFYDRRRTSAPISTRPIKQLFDHYKDTTSNIIDFDGTTRLCDDLEIDPTQIEFLVLSYHLGSSNMGKFERDKFVKGCVDLRCDSTEALRDKVKTLTRDMAEDDARFKEIYMYAFSFGQDTGQKNLSLEAAIELWRLLLDNRFSQMNEWVEFLKENHAKSISKDTWHMFLDFSSQYDRELDTYDAAGAWPVLIDEFVEYVQKEAQ